MRLPSLPTHPTSYLCFVLGDTFHNYLKDSKGCLNLELGSAAEQQGLAQPAPGEPCLFGSPEWGAVASRYEPCTWHKAALLGPPPQLSAGSELIQLRSLLASGCCPLPHPPATGVCLARTDRIPGLGVEPSPPQGYLYSFLSLPAKSCQGQAKKKEEGKKKPTRNKPPLHIKERKYFCQFLFFYNYVCKK